jgi:cytochrome c biogenesis protein CcmG/thiol:disulfide interchange protein DsbE
MKIKKITKKTIIIISLILICFTWVQSAAVPDFSLKGLDGNSFKLSDYLGGKVIVIDFWATWCKPCKKLLKKLNKFYLEKKEEIEVLAISVDDSSAYAMVESYVKGKNFQFKVLLDPDSQVSRILNPSQKIPFTMIIDKNGDIVYTHSGYIPGYEHKIKEIIEETLKANNN